MRRITNLSMVAAMTMAVSAATRMVGAKHSWVTAVLASGLVALGLLALLAPPTRAQAEPTVVVNGDFETGDLSGWTASPAPGGEVSAVQSWHDDFFNIGMPPQEGSYFALLVPGAGDQTSNLSQTLTVQAGDTVSGWAFFASMDDPPYYDYGQIVIKSGDARVAFPFAEGATGCCGRTTWIRWKHTFSRSGTFTILAEVENDIDSSGDSILGVDGVELRPNAAPEINPLLPSPGSATTDRTPTIKAEVTDDVTNLRKADISLRLDGKTKQVAYDRSTDVLAFTPNRRLSSGPHTVKVRAEDAMGEATAKTWTFTVR